MEKTCDCFRKVRSRSRWLLAPFAAAMMGCGSLDSAKQVTPRKELLDLRITEVNYHPLDEDGQSGEDFEFIEIKNAGSSTLSLNKVGFTDGIDFTFPSGTTLEAGHFLVLAADAGSFESRYGFEPFGAYTGKLNNAGEDVELSDLPSETLIASVQYADGGTWPEQADGGGFSLVPVTSAAGASGLGGAWRCSFAINGSPGKEDPAVALVNEVSSRTDPPDKDAIELFNPNGDALDVGGWYLSDKRTGPGKFRIPSGTEIPAQGYVVFDADDFNADTASPASFSLNAHGDGVYLSADSAGCGSAFCHGFSFGEIGKGATFGRLVASSGEEYFVAQKEPSLGSANAGARTGPVVISEAMYHPADDRNEYLELANVGADDVDMFDPDNPENTWRISGLGFKFPQGVTLAAGEVVLIISDTLSEADFRSVYGISGSTRIFKKTGELSNMSDTLELLKPEEPYVDTDSGVAAIKLPYMTMDQLLYTDDSPWPVDADGGGKSLIRIDLEAFASDPANWKAAGPGPGKVE